MTDVSTPRQSHLTFLEAVRAYELEIARKYLPASMAQGVSCRLLEVGAGTGVQALRLSELGYTVSALEVKDSSYRSVRCFDIVEYDGVNIPLLDQSHDVVFSSNVLEHIVQLDEVLRETHRVLSDDGVCVHLVPTSSCRAWTLVAHYVWLTRRVMRKLLTVRRQLPRLGTFRVCRLLLARGCGRCSHRGMGKGGIQLPRFIIIPALSGAKNLNKTTFRCFMLTLIIFSTRCPMHLAQI